MEIQTGRQIEVQTDVPLEIIIYIEEERILSLTNILLGQQGLFPSFINKSSHQSCGISISMISIVKEKKND